MDIKNFEKDIREVDNFVSNQWEIIKDEVEVILRKYSKNEKELKELKIFINKNLHGLLGGITLDAFDIVYDRILDHDEHTVLGEEK